MRHDPVAAAIGRAAAAGNSPLIVRRWAAFLVLSGLYTTAVSGNAQDIGVNRMTSIARGSFIVKLAPQGAPDAANGISLGRLSLDKIVEGDLVATSVGEMLTALTPIQGSAGYVAIERMIGTLHGRSGSFVLQHSGTMDRGTQHQAITVVPDSGTDELAGLSGAFRIEIKEGKHFYEFRYSLP